MGLLENAITLIVADHGESLGEHDYWGHGRRVYEPSLHVPMVLYAPALFLEARRIREPVSTLDILPTLVALLDLPIPDVFGAEGTDLSGFLIEQRPLPAKTMYFETFKGTLKGLTKVVAKEQPNNPSLLGYYNDNVKYILHPSSARIEVYDLSGDPAEQQNLSSPGPASHVESHLMGWFQKGQNMEPARPNLSQEDIEQLRSLGYIE
jgi:arylsulfatase A-like enzyme